MILKDAEATKGRESVAKLVKPGVRLPDQVFERDFDQYCWLEFDEGMDAAFFECLVAMSAAHSSRGFLIACLDPEPVVNFGHEGIGWVELDDSVEVFGEIFDTGLVDPVITIRNVAHRIAFVAENGRWALVADRSAEVTVGAQLGTMGWPAVRDLRYQPFDAMLRLAALPYRDELPQRVRDRYEQNYRQRSWVPWGAHRAGVRRRPM